MDNNRTDGESKKLKPAGVLSLLEKVKRRDGHKKEFIQCVEEILTSLDVVFTANPEYLDVMERILEPERAIQFRVAWIDDSGKQQVNRGWRIQFSSAIGPYKGGLRFHPSVNSSVSFF